MASNNESGCVKIAVIIGAIAALVTIVIFVTGKPNLPELLGARQAGPTIRPTDTPLPRSTSIVAPTVVPTLRLTDTPLPRPTSTVVPTAVPTLRPTNTLSPKPTSTETPIPSPTPIPDTPPGTILEVGQAWRQGGLELRLTEAGFLPNIIIVQCFLANVGTTQRVLQYGQDNFSAVDNRGRRVDTGGVTWGDGPRVAHDCTLRTEIMKPGDSKWVYIPCAWPNYEGVALAVDVADTTITEIVITASGISSINNARWRIPIHH